MFINSEQCIYLNNIMDIREKDILDQAVKEIRGATGLRIQRRLGTKAAGPDATVCVFRNQKEICFDVEIKRTVTNAVLPYIADKLKQYPKRGLLIADYINPVMADKLKELEIQFIDAAGNAFINEPGIFTYIKGNRPKEIYAPKRFLRAFKPTGLQVIYALLCNPALIEENYRAIAKAAKVALGTVGWVLRDLKELGYVVQLRKKRLLRAEELFRKWVEAYPQQLRPKLMLGRYTATNNDWWRDAKLKQDCEFWGGEVAAAKLTQHLKPEIITIYTKEVPTKILADNKLRADPKGNIEILKVFWDFEDQRTNIELVHPVLIYADLVATGDARNLETAELIFKGDYFGFNREA